MNLFNQQLLVCFQSKKAIKLISGLNNLNINRIVSIVKAAELSEASYLDIVANPQIVTIVKSITNIPICVSSIDPLELYNCIISGADLVEIGNFDYFYQHNITFSINEIIHLAKEARYLIKDKDICVTIPYYFSLSDQVNLAIQLEQIGINIIQTEGISSRGNYENNKKNDLFINSVNNSISTLASTYVISHAVNIPVITSSKLDCISSSFAIQCGASGIGLGSNLWKQKTIYNMSCYINEIYNSLDYGFNFNNMNIFLSVKHKIKNFILNYSSN